MTGIGGIVIDNFESKLDRLMAAYTQLVKENAILRERLGHQSIELAEARDRYDELTESYEKLKLAKIISVADSDVSDTRDRLSKLVREVDRCIALLNASVQKDEML